MVWNEGGIIGGSRETYGIKSIDAKNLRGVNKGGSRETDRWFPKGCFSLSEVRVEKRHSKRR